ncbi:MAG: hypothetical protein LJE84_08720 [Gammaproteobacteria bacterium]|jgi:hypothetical protein|nr:hypothetical protein [Gammaproteobacteria bacterium]
MGVLIRLLLALAFATTCYFSGTTLVDRHQGLVLDQDLLQRAEQLAADGDLAEARMLARFVLEHPQLGDVDAARALDARLTGELESFWGQARRFAQGAVSGEPRDTASLLGTLSLDLFVIGDIRDLVVQGGRELNDGSGDDLILALSAVGLVTTLLPEVDWAPALMKAFRRAGAFSARFLHTLKGMARTALKQRRFGKLRRVAEDFGKTVSRLGPGPAMGVMKNVDKTGDLARVARAAARDPVGTYVLGSRFGRKGIGRLAADGGNVTRLVNTIKVSARLGKAGSKTLKTTLGAVLRNLPTLQLTGLFLASLVLSLGLLVGAGTRRRRPRGATA